MLESYILKFNNSDDIDDFNDEYLKPSINILFEIFEKLFNEINSSGFDYKNLLAHFNLSNDNDSPVPLIFDYFKGYFDKLDDGEILAKILEILLCLNSNESKKELRSQIYDFASNLLFKEYSTLKGERLSAVLTIYVENSKNPFREMLNVTDTMLIPFVEG